MAAPVNFSSPTAGRAIFSTRRNSLLLISVLTNPTSHRGLRIEDISNEAPRGHYQSGATEIVFASAAALGPTLVRQHIQTRQGNRAFWRDSGNSRGTG